MGNSSSSSSPPLEDEEPDSGSTEIIREPDIIEPARPPDEERVDSNIIENLDQPLEDDAFILGTESSYDETKAAILKKSEEDGKQYVYRDTSFPATDESLYFKHTSNKWSNIEWKRPFELSEKARLVKEGVADDDIIQGRLGNCWWLSSVGAICRIQKYMNRIIPADQTLSGEEYIGAFHFRFWRFGSWVDVVVDDRLPVQNGRLVFGRSSEPDEFWISFLEKAYAKIHGTYQAIEGGYTQDALEDLTGGLAVIYQLKEKTPNFLYSSLIKAFKNDTFVCCSIEGSGETEDKRTGLVSAHAYTVTAAKKVLYRGKQEPLLRIRNPWGNRVEWKGNWSDSSPQWDELDQIQKDRLGFVDADNGEWWMHFDDFKYYFNDVTICTIGPDFDKDGAASGDRWYLSKAKGKWIKGYSAGGCRNEVEKFATNPQYYLELREPDDFDPDVDDAEAEGKCSILVGLMQEYRRVGKADGLENHHIGFSIYKVKSRPPGRLSIDYFRYNRDYMHSGTFVNNREVSASAFLPPGHYVIVPSTFYADKVASFLLRIFTEKQINLEDLG